MRARARCIAQLVVAAWAAGAVNVPFAAAAYPRPDPPDGTSAPSDSVLLFREGRALLEAKDYRGAAAKFEESFRLDPGGGTQLNLALAYELAGRTASAMAAFQVALRLGQEDRREDRIQEARSHIHELEARASRLRVVVPESVVPASGLELRCDGVALGEASWNADVTLDPGDHRIEATARDKKPWTAIVTLGKDADRQEVVVPPLVDEPRPLDTHDLRGARGLPLEARSTAARTARGYVALTAAGVLAGAGVVAWRVREDNLSIYDDDARCLVGEQTRDQQCGGHGRAADVALGVEIGAFAASGISAALAGWLLWGPSGERRGAKASCFPVLAQAIVCRGTF